MYDNHIFKKAKEKKIIVRIFDLRDHSINEVNNAAHTNFIIFFTW